MHKVPPEPVANEDTPFGQLQIFATQFWADTDAAVAEILYPTLHALQSNVAVSQSVAPEPDAMVGVPLGQVHVLALHVNELNSPLIPHVAVPPPVNPEVLHMTVTVCPVVPIKKREEEC